jgi:hypothetical protein
MGDPVSCILQCVVQFFQQNGHVMLHHAGMHLMKEGLELIEERLHTSSVQKQIEKERSRGYVSRVQPSTHGSVQPSTHSNTPNNDPTDDISLFDLELTASDYAFLYVSSHEFVNSTAQSYFTAHEKGNTSTMFASILNYRI